MTADDLAMQLAKASAGMVLAEFFQIILVSPQKVDLSNAIPIHVQDADAFLTARFREVSKPWYWVF